MELDGVALLSLTRIAVDDWVHRAGSREDDAVLEMEKEVKWVELDPWKAIAPSATQNLSPVGTVFRNVRYCICGRISDRWDAMERLLNNVSCRD